jgi:hypothetical protein
MFIYTRYFVYFLLIIASVQRPLVGDVICLTGEAGAGKTVLASQYIRYSLFFLSQLSPLSLSLFLSFLSPSVSLSLSVFRSLSLGPFLTCWQRYAEISAPCGNLSNLRPRQQIPTSWKEFPQGTSNERECSWQREKRSLISFPFFVSDVDSTYRSV